jgi:curli biogenesis system outer membrane secretion channel CsgG
MKNIFLCGGLTLGLLLAGGCATESHRAVEVQQVSGASRPFTGVKQSLVIGKFENRSTYLRGIFSDGVDRLGGQAKTILMAHLQQSGRFSVMDRDNAEETKAEATLAGRTQTLKSASYALTGSVTEFGRKETGDEALFGIAGSGKRQAAYCKVTVNVVDVLTSELVYSVQGAGEYALSNREVIGFGSTAGYDSTLNGKVLDLAIKQAVEALTTGLEAGKWGASK